MADRSTADFLMSELEAGGIARVESFIKEPTAETLYLDFTTKKEPAVAALALDDKRNYAKALSGFANSDGGILVWGIYAAKDHTKPEEPDLAQKLSPIIGVSKFVTNLDNLLSTICRPAVPGVRNFVFRKKKSDSGYAITYVPVGLLPPYRAEVDMRKYYKRSGDSFVEMEPYEIRDVVFRFGYPKIRIDLERRHLEQKQDIHVYSLEVTLENMGPTTLKEYKLVFWLPRSMYVDSSNLNDVGTLKREDVIFIGLAQAISTNFNLFPEDRVRIIGERTTYQIRYKMDHNLYEKGFHLQTLYWELYGHNMPPVRGSRKFLDERLPDKEWLVFF